MNHNYHRTKNLFHQNFFFRSKVSSLIFFIIILCNPIFSQNEADNTKDFETWSAIEIVYKPSKKISLGLEEQLRLKENSSITDQYFTQIQFDYEAFKNFEFGVGLRYIRKNDTRGNIQGYEDHFRFHVDGSYNHKINQFSFKYRFRYQNKNELGISSSESDYPNQHLRFKTSVDYSFKNWKLDPKFSAEVFNHFEKGETNGFDKYRLTVGTDYKLKKFGKLSLFYRLERELNVDNPKTIQIIKFKYTYTLKSY